VYGFADGSYLYAAYEADISEDGWALACVLNVNANFYFKTPQSASWPDEGYTIFEMVFPRYMQTDGSGWDDKGALSGLSGLEYAFIDMFTVTTSDCQSGAAGNNIAEFKIPLSVLTYAGDDGEILLAGQYWQYDFSDLFFVELPRTRQVCHKNDAPPRRSSLDVTIEVAAEAVPTHLAHGDYLGPCA
jgi:hypothetical protein